jgi:histidine triad (HIT) family protein
MCLLCKSEDGFKSDLIILETEFCFVIANLFPIGDVSFLILPKRHVLSISETTNEELADLMQLIKNVVSSVEKDGYDNYNVFWSNGKFAGQTIPHLHCHVVTKTEDNGVKIKRIKNSHEITSEELLKLKKILS